MPHQICQFHIVAEVVKAVVWAVASARKGLAAQQPKLRKGRPSTPAAKQAVRTKKRLEAQHAGLFTHRYLFVQRHRTPPNASPCGASPVICPSCARCAPSRREISGSSGLANSIRSFCETTIGRVEMAIAAQENRVLMSDGTRNRCKLALTAQTPPCCEERPLMAEWAVFVVKVPCKSQYLCSNFCKHMAASY